MHIHRPWPARLSSRHSGEEDQELARTFPGLNSKVRHLQLSLLSCQMEKSLFPLFWIFLEMGERRLRPWSASPAHLKPGHGETRGVSSEPGKGIFCASLLQQNSNESRQTAFGVQTLARPMGNLSVHWAPRHAPARRFTAPVDSLCTESWNNQVSHTTPVQRGGQDRELLTRKAFSNL